jgi:hypothetical protein
MLFRAGRSILRTDQKAVDLELALDNRLTQMEEGLDATIEKLDAAIEISEIAYQEVTTAIWVETAHDPHAKVDVGDNSHDQNSSPSLRRIGQNWLRKSAGLVQRVRLRLF